MIKNMLLFVLDVNKNIILALTVHGLQFIQVFHPPFTYFHHSQGMYMNSL